MSEGNESGIHDISEPMEQDIGSPEVATASQSDTQVYSQQQPANRGFLQKVFGSKSDPQVEPAKPELSYRERFVELENKELLSNGLSAEDYATLFMMDIITGKRSYLDTLYRAKQRYPKDDTLKSLSQLAEYLSSWDIRGAIKYLRGMKTRTDKMVKYFAELENRLLAINLIMISRTYTSLTPEYLCKLLEISAVEEANTLFTACDWTFVDNKVNISYTDNLEKYVFNNLINKEMGSFELLETVLPKSKSTEKLPMERIKELMAISDKLLKISVPKNDPNEAEFVSGQA